MRTNTTGSNTNRHTAGRALGWVLLLLATALLLQGCATVKPAWSCNTDDTPLLSSTFDRPEPREGIAILNVRF